MLQTRLINSSNVHEAGLQDTVHLASLHLGKQLSTAYIAATL
jgi:hypothetical protein